ncbi:hypothetical protein D3C85_850630 [compost metagenome]
MHPEGVEAVVILELVFQPDRADIGDRTRDQADQEGALRVDEAGGGSDGDQAGDHAGQQAQQGRLFLQRPLHRDPADGGGGGGQQGVEDGDGGDLIGARGRAAVEAHPADEQQPGADGGEGQVVRGHVVPAPAVARTQNDGADQTGHARVDVDHGPAGEVEHAQLAHPAAAPDLMADRRIDDQVPQGEEEDAGRELDPFGEGARDQGRGDDGEGQLIADPQELGQAGGQGVGRLDPDAVEEEGLNPADEAVGGRAAGPEGQGVAGDEPEDGDDGHGRRRMGDGGDQVLLPNHAAVEEGQTRQGHHQHQGRRGQNPGRARAVQRQRDLMRQQIGGRRSQGGRRKRKGEKAATECCGLGDRRWVHEGLGEKTRAKRKGDVRPVGPA